FSTTNTIEVFVSNLRRKLEADGDERLLHTIRGAGYVLRAYPDRAPPAHERAAVGELRQASDPRAPGERLGPPDVRDPMRLRRRDRLADGAPHPQRLQPPGAGHRDPAALRAAHHLAVEVVADA